MPETKLSPDKLITVEDDVLVNGKLFPFQTQYNFDRIEEGTLNGCCEKIDHYIVIINDVEYPIPSDKAFLSTPKPATEGVEDYWEDVKYSWPVKDESELFRPDPNKILENANKVIDKKM